MSHSGWAKVLTDAGYIIQHEHSTYGTFGDRESVLTIILKDGIEVLRIEQNFDGKGGKSLYEIYRVAAIKLGLATKNDYCPTGPVDLNIKKTGEGVHEQTVYSHPSFGVASINRYQGKTRHFMSPVDTFGGMTIDIKSADLRTSDIGTEYVFAGKHLCSFTMSFTQFAELITSGGSEVPITLNFIDGIGIDEFPTMPTRYERIKQRLDEDLASAVTEIQELINEIEPEMKASGSMSSPRKKEIWAKLGKSLRTITTKPAWLSHLFVEGTQEILAHAKGEFVAWADQASKTKGHILEGIQTPEQKSLESNVKSDHG